MSEHNIYIIVYIVIVCRYMYNDHTNLRKLLLYPQIIGHFDNLSLLSQRVSFQETSSEHGREGGGGREVHSETDNVDARETAPPSLDS